MIRKFAKLLILPLLFASAGLLAYPMVDPSIHTLSTTYFCSGDDYGDFVNDYVAVLSDGSAWKVHPGDTEMYGQWANGDIVHVQVRTSFFWFKREHKFELQNFTRNQSVRVMLMQYPTYPLSILTVQYVEMGGSFVDRNTTNAFGETFTERVWIPKLAADLYLSDGTVWRLQGENIHFQAGNYVYFSIHREIDKTWNFLISGKQREAVWQKVDRVL